MTHVGKCPSQSDQHQRVTGKTSIINAGISRPRSHATAPIPVQEI